MLSYLLQAIITSFFAVIFTFFFTLLYSYIRYKKAPEKHVLANIEYFYIGFFTSLFVFNCMKITRVPQLF